MCDKVKEGDSKYTQAMQIVEQGGCKEKNDELEVCLKQNNKDWRICREFVVKLGECVRNNQKSSLSNSPIP